MERGRNAVAFFLYPLGRFFFGSSAPQFVEDFEEHRQIKWLFHESTGAWNVVSMIQIGLARDDDDGQERLQRDQVLKSAPAAFVPEVEIQQDDVNSGGGEFAH